VGKRNRDTCIVDDGGSVWVACVIECRRALHAEWEVSSDTFDTPDEPWQKRFV